MTESNDALDARGSFYLGRQLDPAGELASPLLYDSRDLTTHAVCVGMTGSGKTGLCLTLLEEAALDGVPALCIDPKGDLGNLALTFPDLLPQNFEPWIDPAEAERKGVSVEERAVSVADKWREGLASWSQDGERIQRFRDAADVSIYTPGSSAGLSLSVLERLEAPKTDDAEATRERVQGAVSSLLALVGINADPVQSREHVFLSNIVHHYWAAGEDLELGTLVQAILEPPFERIGVLDVDAFFGKKDRQSLAMKLNALLASPSFAGWLEGEPLDIQKLLFRENGQPRITILSIAHLSDVERMFFVTLVLGELVAWMRAQAGTSGLRALLYMDEVVGFLPPVAKPPSKAPLMTLLKQARAFGVGCVLATQNPVDVDYKALSNCGTWFLGRLQTERDVDRVIDGLDGASQLAGQSLDTQEVRRTLAGLKSRVFLMNNVHRDGPELFHTRWALSYLRGPLTRTQISTLMENHWARDVDAEPVEEETPSRRSASDTIVDPSPLGASAAAAGATAMGAATAGASPASTSAPDPAENTPAESANEPADEPVSDPRPVIPDHVEEFFVHGAAGATWIPHLLVGMQLTYEHSRSDTSHEYTPALLMPLHADPSTCAEGSTLVNPPNLGAEPDAEREFVSPVAKTLSKSWLKSLQASLKTVCIDRYPLVIGQCKPLGLWSRPDETRDEFAARLQESAASHLQDERDKLEDKYQKRIRSATDKVETAKARVEREQDQASAAKMDTGISVGSAVLGAIFGNGTVRGHARRAASSAKRARNASRQARDVERAARKLSDAEEALADLEIELDEKLNELEGETHAVDEVSIRVKRTNARVSRLALVWVPSNT